MNPAANEIEARVEANAKTWLLPTRDSSSIRSFAWAALGSGIIGCLFMLVWASGLLSLAVLFGFQNPIVLLFPIGMFLAARNYLMDFPRHLWFAVKLLRNQSRLELKIDDGQLSSVEKLGWLDLETRIPIDGVYSFSVEKALPKDHLPVALPIDLGCHVQALVAHYQSGAKVAIASAYPRQLLAEQANQLSAAIGLSDSAADNADPVAVLETESQPLEVQIVKEKPAGSKIVVHESGEDSVTYKVPRIGFTKRAIALAVFRIFWCGFILVFLGDSIASGSWGHTLFAVLFVLIGIAMVIKLVQGIYRETMIGVIGDQLFVETKSCFQKDWLEYHRDDIRAIVVGDAEMSENGHTVKELHLLMRDDQRALLLPFLSEPELDWLAFSLSHDLGLQLGEEKLDWKKELDWSGIESKNALGSSGAKVVQSNEEVSITVPSKWENDKVEWFVAAIFLAGLTVFFSFFFGELNLAFAIMATIGTACFLIGMLEYYTRGFHFVCSDNHLKLVRKSIFLQREFHWDKQQIVEIQVHCDAIVPDASNKYYLAIEGDDGIFTVLSGRPKQQLASLAGSLSEALNLGENKLEAPSGVSQSAKQLSPLAPRK